MLNDKVVIVTGGGAGIGEAVSKRLALDGAKVIVADINEEAARKVSEAITSAGGTACAARVDVADEASVKAMVDFAVKQYGRLDGAVNNAAIGSKISPIAEIDLADWNKVLGISLTGTLLSLKHETPAIEAAGGGSIVNLSSDAGLHAVKFMAPYCASKHAVNGLTKTAAVELAEKKIRVNAVCPGAVDTPGLLAAVAGGLDLWDHGAPMKRNAKPDEIAATVALLLSNGAGYITGVCLPVDGGMGA